MAKSKKSKKKKKPDQDPNEKVVTENRKARHRYEVLDTLECGLVLHGSEVKSLRNGHVSLEEAYARVKKGEVWLIGCDIQEYFEANRMNHDQRRQRKLLMHRIQIRKFANLAHEKGLALVPLKIYFKKGVAKLLLGLCKGKKQHDKREALKKADSRRDMQREIRRRVR
jgi:SsrA-binding protein